MSSVVETRAVIKRNYALIPETGYVENRIPGIENTFVTILVSPRIGASFVAYRMVAHPGGHTEFPFAREENIELFLLLVNGTLHAENSELSADLPENGYFYSAPGCGLSFENTSSEDAVFIVYKYRYRPLQYKGEWLRPASLSGCLADKFEGWAKDSFTCLHLLPEDPAYDIAMNIMIFNPSRKLDFIEIHDQEHGLYTLSGEASYYLDDTWYPIMKTDFIWMGPYVPQGVYATSTEIFSYLLSKEQNRDAEL